MAFPEVVTRQGWLAARKRLLATEKEHTRSRDALNAERRRLPMVRIDKEYVFEGPEGNVTLAGLFGEREIVSGDTTTAEVPGLSCFLRDGDDIFHTYSTYARGTDSLGGTYSLLDLTALGRQEDWEEPKGRAPRLHGPDPTFTD